MPKNPPKPQFTPAKIPLQSRNHDNPTIILMPNYPNSNKNYQKPNKFLVYLLFLFVLLCFVALVFASLVLRVKNPAFRIDSATLKSLKYDYTPSFNISLSMKISLSNRNFGHLEFDNDPTKNFVNLVYGNSSSVVSLSALKFRSGRVGSRGEEHAGIEMNVNSNLLKSDDKIRVLEDMNSGVLEFTSLARLKGEVHLLRKLRLSTLAAMNCTFQIDLVHPSVQRLQC